MSIAEFIRNALDNQQVTIKYELVADVPEIKKLIGEFGKIGSNLNQIARYLIKVESYTDRNAVGK